MPAGLSKHSVFETRPLHSAKRHNLVRAVEVLKAARAQGKLLQLSRLQERPRYILEATRLLHLFVEVNPEIPEASRSQSGRAS